MKCSVVLIDSSTGGVINSPLSIYNITCSSALLITGVSMSSDGSSWEITVKANTMAAAVGSLSITTIDASLSGGTAVHVNMSPFGITILNPRTLLCTVMLFSLSMCVLSNASCVCRLCILVLCVVRAFA